MSIIRKVYKHMRDCKLKTHSLYQLKGATIGDNNNVFGKINIVDSHNLVIGNNCSFNHGTYINAGNGIIIGDDVTISAQVSIVSTGIDYESWVNGKKEHVSDGMIKIGNHVWIGSNAVILPKVSIDAEYVVIAAGSVVTKNIRDSYSIYAGIPAKKIKSINHDTED